MDGQLIEFRTQNHRSLRDEQVLSFVATDDGRPGLIHPTGLKETLVPVAAIYGANASGKSNVLGALAFMARLVALSQTGLQPDEGIPRQPHLLGDGASTPSMFSVQVMLDGTRYEFGFAATNENVVEEWLHAWPSGRTQEWYSRDGQSFDFGRNLQGENKAIEALTRPNSLFLSAAAQNNHPQLTPIYRWFSQRLRVLDFSGAIPKEQRLRGAQAWWAQFSEKNSVRVSLFPDDDPDRHRNQVRSLLSSSDLGIADFMVEEERPSGGRAQPSPPGSRRTRLTFAHESRANAGRVWFDLDQESTGTQMLVTMLPYLLPILDEGGLLAIDELNSLHPTLALAIVQLFQDPARNSHGAQLLFSTHETALLGSLLSDPPPLQRDQIWLTEKDRDGATVLYPLTDFKPRPTENLQRGYLQGRYGAIPFIGALDVTAKKEGDGA